MAEPPVVLEQDGGIAHVILNAPPRNEMNREFFEAWAELVHGSLPKLDADAVVVRGRGRHFSSGADVAELRRRLPRTTRGDEPVDDFLRAAATGFEALAQLPMPVVAAISGACLGSGLELALACHVRIATPTAVLGLPESTFDLLPGCGGTVRLPQIVGVGRAVELILTGRRMLATEAAAIGLVDVVVERQQLRSSVARLIQNLR